MGTLSATSYAVLGQLALRRWTTYELAAEMPRNLRFFFPRAERSVYAELKRLAEFGLARAEHEYVGKRRRAVYEITAEGRRALEEWLGTPPAGFSLEFEGLLRVFVASFGTTEQLIAALDGAKAEAEEIINVATPIGRSYLEGRAPFQEWVHDRAFIFDFLWSYAHTIKDWAERTKAEVEARDGLSQEEKQERALRIIERALDG